MQEIFAIKSHVIRGVGMGRKLGYPTINLVYPENSDFENGVYVARVSFPDDIYFGVMHLGNRATFDDEETFEIHLFDFPVGEDAVGTEVYVEVYEKLRDVEKFENEKALVKQIEEDIDEAKNFFENYADELS